MDRLWLALVPGVAVIGLAAASYATHIYLFGHYWERRFVDTRRMAFREIGRDYDAVKEYVPRWVVAIGEALVVMFLWAIWLMIFWTILFFQLL